MQQTGAAAEMSITQFK
ncbi:MAG: hypothetical protein MK192_04945 [Idiomarina sp.]|nr:hypothetical protein [Idiomarina sp.]